MSSGKKGFQGSGTEMNSWRTRLADIDLFGAKSDVQTPSTEWGSGGLNSAVEVTLGFDNLWFDLNVLPLRSPEMFEIKSHIG